MSTSTNDKDAGFVDLSHIDQVKPISVHARGNIIRTQPAVGPAAGPAAAAGDHAPEIVVHRNGDEVSAIEFVCSCGKRSTVRIEYDDE
jgi:hypothetical protein